jgi:hypothetical protein
MNHSSTKDWHTETAMELAEAKREVEALRAEARVAADVSEGWRLRALAAEAKLATARKDALDEALALVFTMTRGVPDDHGILESIYDRLRAL